MSNDRTGIPWLAATGHHPETQAFAQANFMVSHGATERRKTATIRGCPGRAVRLRRGTITAEFTLPASGLLAWDGQPLAANQQPSNHSP